MINFPEGLHPSTVELVEGFATALAEKLRRSEIKYGWSDGWKDTDWQEKCLEDFNYHIDKGDPRDVAAYCAFMWFHGWQTQRLHATAQPVSDGWIRCTDSLPDSEGKYLVYETLNNRVNHDYWMEPEPAEGFWNHYDTSVTHWMPLPVAPGGQDD